MWSLRAGAGSVAALRSGGPSESPPQRPAAADGPPGAPVPPGRPVAPRSRLPLTALWQNLVALNALESAHV